MMPAAKHGDNQIGIDIHLCVVPLVPSPVPLPTPHLSVVFDPFDYIPVFGATVTVCGMKRATAGTAGVVIHIPPGFPFAPKLPSLEDELFMGSMTVTADGDPLSHTTHPVLGCQAIGIPAPFRPKKKGPLNINMLPTEVNLATPTNVFIGGPPTVSFMTLAFAAGFKALGKFAKSGLFKRMRQVMFKKLDPGFLKCVVLRAEPVNILNGEVSVDHQDFSLPGRINIDWIRSYESGKKRKGACGYGWETFADIRLEKNEETGEVYCYHPSKGSIVFTGFPQQVGYVNAQLELIDGALLWDTGEEYRVQTKEDLIYSFVKHTNSNKECRITRISDLCGNEWNYEWKREEIAGIRESAGRYLEITSEEGLIREIALQETDTEPRHVFVRYQYDENNDLIAALDSYQKPYEFEYQHHQMLRHTDRNDLTFYYEFEHVNEQWRVIHAWGDDGLYDYTFEYQDELNERKVINSLGHVSLIKLDDNGLPISEIDPLDGMMVFEYDDAGRTIATIDQDGHRTEYDYDDRGNLLKLVRPDGSSVKTKFNSENKAISITDPNGANWKQEWNKRGLLTQQVSPMEAESLYQYDKYGQLISYTNPLKAQTKLSYDHFGNLIKLTEAPGYITLFNYDLRGNVISKKDALAQITDYSYDTKGRLTKARMPSGSCITCSYDPEDNLTCYTDENGEETHLEYFGQGEIKRRIQADGHSVKYHYDTEEQLIGVSNQRGEHYQLIRDPLGRITEEIDYWGQGRKYSYTGAGFLKESIDPLERVIQYETDSLGRIVKKALPDAEINKGIHYESFEYDANGNLIACENTAIRIERDFDDEGLLIQERQGKECKISNGYDLNGNRTSRTTEVLTGIRSYQNTVDYQYDLLDQAITVKLEGHDPLKLTRNALGQVTEESLSKNVHRDLEYDQDGYLTAQKVTSREGSVFEQAYQYDQTGNLLERRDSAIGIDQYHYDPIGRLISHTNPEGKFTQYLNDPAGDRLTTRITESHTEDSEIKEWYRYGEYEGSKYRFDQAGNLVERSNSKDETHFVWDANQRLCESTRKGQSTQYQYDPLGRRISKTTDGVSTQFFWDGDALLGDIVLEEDNKEQCQKSSRLREWVYYPETFEPLLMAHSHEEAINEIYLYNNDPNGCPTRLLDLEGKVVWAAEYSAWGGVDRLLVDRVDNPLRLQGQYWDGETELYYNHYRYFEPIYGGFISMDPLGLYVGVSNYLYGLNIFSWIDPLGLACRVVKATNRSGALKLARKHAKVQRVSKGGRVISMNVLNETSRGKNWNKMKAAGGQKLGMENPNGKNKWFEHPDGHPDAGTPGAPSHHSSGHVHATNSKGECIVFTW